MDSSKQIEQMANFILNEAKDKAAEMEAKTLEDFNIEKLKKVQAMKEKVRQDTLKKQTQMKTQTAVEQSQASNKCRLKKAATSSAMIDKVKEETLKKIVQLADDKSNYSSLLAELVLEGAMMLLEDTLYIRVKETETQLMTTQFDAIQDKYLTMLNKAGVPEDVTALQLNLDTQYLPKNSPGGVVVFNKDKKIFIDNSLEHRLNLAIEEKMPELKQLMCQ